jgi:hypothetical protein
MHTLASLISDTLGSASQDAERRMEALGNQLMQILGSGTLDTERRMQAVAETISATINSETQDAERRVHHLASLIVERIGSGTQEAETRLHALNALVADTIGSGTLDAERRVQGLVSELNDAVGSGTADAERRMQALLSSLADRIGAGTHDAELRLRALSAAIPDQIETGTIEAERRIEALATGVSKVLAQNAGEVERTLLGVSAEVVRAMGGKAEELTTTLNHRGQDLTRVLDEKSSAFLSALDTKSRALTGEVARITGETVKAIEAKSQSFTGEVIRVTDQTMKTFDGKGTGLAKAILANSEEIVRLITQASANATASVGKALSDLEDKAKLAVEKSQRTSTAAVAEMLETHSMLRNDTTALFDRLREANVLLQEVLTGATQNLGTIETTLSTRVKEFVTALGDISDRSGSASTEVEKQVRSFHSVTSNVLNDIMSVASRFEEQGRALSSAASMLEDNHRRVEATFAERQAALDTVVDELGSRTETLDQRFERFSTLLQDQLTAAEARAREIARVIAESSTEGTRAIASQYEQMRTITEEERTRTQTTLRTLFEETTNETHSLFERAAERFARLVADMKEASGAVQRELDETREQLRRGIFELPQDTAESTAQMRRVIVEQIDALAELNRIVAKHGRSIDAAQPRSAAVREEAMAAVASATGQIASSRAPSAPAARRAEPRASADGDGGWNEDAGGTPAAKRGSLGPLDTISIDIAHMVDHDAAVDLWERRRRGHAPADRRLYTQPGLQTFEEIRRKYNADRDFRATVDRYVAEFERLLDEVAQDDRNSAVARSYLTSDTGKVYTMLAHAAGRLD